MKIFLTLISIFLLPLLVKAQQEGPYLQDLYKSLAEAKTDTAQMRAYSNLGSYYLLEDRDSTNLYLGKALPIAVRLNLKLDEASILNNMGVILMQEEKFSKSLQFYLKALTIAKDPAIEKNVWNLPPGETPAKARLHEISNSYDLIGLLNAYTGNWSDNIYNQMKNYREAEKYAKEAEDTLRMAYINFHLGIAYMNEGKYDSALLLIKNALAIFSERNATSGSGRALKYLGDTYQKMGKPELAARTLQQSLSFLKKTNDYVHIGLACISLNRVYTDLNKNDSALYYARECLKIYERRRDPIGKKDAYNLLASHYDLVGRSDSATAYLKMAKSLSDSLSEEVRKNLLAFQDVVVSEQVKLEKLEKEKIATREKYRTWLFLSVILISAGIVVMLYRNNQYRKKTNETLRLRNDEIENALHQLKSAQTQLIHSEKMASLGELTAGIAHEIQNPLNFVNNFSDINKELLTEMNDELAKGNFGEVKALAADVIDNEEKINHHGKRADSIVKSMLQHSRTGIGQKESTDLNALADQYLRLSYHGLLAKDKSFRASFHLSADKTLPTVNVVAQDMGRLLLNLFNNAFYAVNEKRKSGLPDYEPRVQVTTMRKGDEVRIEVKDNGTGIASANIKKIFQPFFTTKPTGEGTGLGLSLSYNILKAHGGELMVDSVEGEGTVFTIILPKGGMV